MIDFLRQILGQRILNYYHLVCAIIANILYGFPSRKLHVIGVTGTDGKTTTVNMIASILRAAGLPTAHLSTVNAQIGDKVYDTGLHTTTPSPFLLQKLIRRAVNAASFFLVLEVTSHALDQYRTWGIKFETAVITNISHEHLDYHKGLSSYMAAKGRIFKNVEYGILNMDDGSYEYFSKIHPHLTSPLEGEELKREQLLTYGLTANAKFWADNIEESLIATKFRVHPPDSKAGAMAETISIELNLPGKFNVYNALAAISVGVNYNVAPEAIQKGLRGVSRIPGRLEFITPPSVPPHQAYPKSEYAFGGPRQGAGRMRVMVDFAHTPNAIENLMQFLRPKISGKIIHVFGSAGERDVTKRPLMGAASDKYADIIVLTREDNRSEQVQDICVQIAQGITRKQNGKEYFIIPDRREAIRTALRLAQGSDDLIIVTGKGHEQSLNVGGVETPWDDREIVREVASSATSRGGG